jgi:transcriptional antiterminator NusG
MGSKKKILTEDKKQGVRQWYAVHTYSGYEDTVKRYLEQRVDTLGLEDKVFRVIVPKEKKIKVRNGKRVAFEEKIYPGYVLIEMILDDNLWYIVRNTPRVIGFVGADPTKPTPLSREEIDSLIVRMGVKEPKFKVDFQPGDLVRITDGPFKDYDGRVSEVDEQRGRVKVLVPIFGRDTAVDLDSLQIKKV